MRKKRKLITTTMHCWDKSVITHGNDNTGLNISLAILTLAAPWSIGRLRKILIGISLALGNNVYILTTYID